jgi:molybdopterin molybdotransferase
MSGARACAALQLTAIATAALKKRPGRTEYLRGVASRDEDGSWRVAPTRSQSSGALSSMSEANCFIVLAHEQGDVAAGERVDIMPFEGLI